MHLTISQASVASVELVLGLWCAKILQIVYDAVGARNRRPTLKLSCQINAHQEQVGVYMHP